MDLEIGDDFDLVLGTSKDFNRVTDGDELAQEFVLLLHNYQREVIGDLNSTNALRKVRLRVNRALAESDDVESVNTVDVSITDRERIDVYIVYNSDQIIDELI